MPRPRLQFPNRDEERILLERAAQGDQRARDAIILNHQPLAYAIAKKYRRFGLPVEDLEQEAIAGLLTALDKFDLAAGVRFNTYAQWWVKAALADYVLRQSQDVRPPTTRKGKTKFFRGGYRFGTVYLDHTIHEDGSPLVEFFTSDDPAPDELAEGAVDAERLRRAIAGIPKLKSRDKTIIDRRLLADEPCTLETLAGVFGLSKERVRQIEKRAYKLISKAVTA